MHDHAPKLSPLLLRNIFRFIRDRYREEFDLNQIECLEQGDLVLPKSFKKIYEGLEERTNAEDPLRKELQSLQLEVGKFRWCSDGSSSSSFLILCPQFRKLLAFWWIWNVCRVRG